MFNPRFAAGQVFTPELWGVMLGRLFYMPALIELVEAIVMPHRRGQVAFSWQIQVPEQFAGVAFSKLFHTLATGDGEDFLVEPEDDGLTPDGPAIAVAIYRSRDDIGPEASLWNGQTG